MMSIRSLGVWGKPYGISSVPRVVTRNIIRLPRYVALAPGRIPVDMAPKATPGRTTVTGEPSYEIMIVNLSRKVS
jgi:hypothetical protein